MNRDVTNLKTFAHSVNLKQVLKIQTNQQHATKRASAKGAVDVEVHQRLEDKLRERQREREKKE